MWYQLLSFIFFYVTWNFLLGKLLGNIFKSGTAEKKVIFTFNYINYHNIIFNFSSAKHIYISIFPLHSTIYQRLPQQQLIIKYVLKVGVDVAWVINLLSHPTLMSSTERRFFFPSFSFLFFYREIIGRHIGTAQSGRDYSCGKAHLHTRKSRRGGVTPMKRGCRRRSVKY